METMTLLEQAATFGSRTARARYDHDESRARYERDAFRRWVRLQVGLGDILETEFARAYKEEYQSREKGI